MSGWLAWTDLMRLWAAVGDAASYSTGMMLLPFATVGTEVIIALAFGEVGGSLMAAIMFVFGRAANAARRP